MQPMPLNYEAEALGFNNLGWAGKYEPDWQFTTVNTDGEWARRNPKVVAGFVRALLRGQQFIFANPDDAAKIAAQVLKTPEPLAARAISEAVRLGILDPQLNGPSSVPRKCTRTCRPTARCRRTSSSMSRRSLTTVICARRKPACAKSPSRRTRAAAR